MGILFYSWRRKDDKAAIVHEVSSDGSSVEVTVCDWPTITTSGNFLQGKKREFVQCKDVYCTLTVVKVVAKGTVYERLSKQCSFPELKAALRKRGGAKSKKGQKITEGIKKKGGQGETKSKK